MLTLCVGGGGFGSCIGIPTSDNRSVIRFDFILKSNGLSLKMNVYSSLSSHILATFSPLSPSFIPG